MNWLVNFVEGFNIKIIKRLFQRKEQKIPAYWQAYTDAMGTEVIQLTNEQKKQAWLEHVLRVYGR